jgi:hypothetical protein
MKYEKYIFMMGNIRPIANFDVKIGNIRNKLNMMGYNELKLTFMLYLLAVGKQMMQK